MALYFFSEARTDSGEGKIEAFTGVKSIVLPGISYDEGLRRMFSDGGSTPEAATIISRLEAFFVSEGREPFFREEYDHFRCLSASLIAGLFHLRNVLLRIAYSATTVSDIPRYRRGTSARLPRRRVHADVAAYYLEYGLFHAVAFPLVEAHALLDPLVRASKERCDHVRPPGAPRSRGRLPSANLPYSPKVTECLDQLRASGITSAAVGHGTVAKAIDAEFLRKLRTSDETPTATPSLEAELDRIALVRWAGAFLTLPLRRPHSWRPIARMVWSNLRLIKPYVFGRLLPSHDRDHRSADTEAAPNTGAVPGILTGGMTVDPAAFTSRNDQREYMPSQELSFEHTRDRSLSDMLWHCIATVAISVRLLREGAEPTQIADLIQTQRSFMGTWKPEGADVQREFLADLHLDLIDEAARWNDRNGSRPLTSRAAATSIARCGRELFAAWWEAAGSVLDEDEEAFSAAINCYYIHV